MPLPRLLLLSLLLALPAASWAQTLPMRPHRLGVPMAPSRATQPSVLRNQPAPAAVTPLPLSRQDRQAYENCPDPRRYGPKARTKKLVRIW
ncbi:hypothetical protein [Hymenobacter jeollabukensis]|uniref:Uncharacterized protein n=1 Tax=Hymenobacter jeollabukensis TaxID=2025313 RepID=A0A5R8WJR9_9BACT|nr:hypothetical protein [Hymenobacter jeollabukensis]TLM89071.1 hypothetical protein FDY95_21110 [Hymenobacter jeollabukensis]